MFKQRYKTLTKLLETTEAIGLNPQDKYVIFSDHHISCDQFDNNKRLYCKVLEYYLHEKFGLILLGDIEELSSLKISEFAEKYGSDVYRLESRFCLSDENPYFRIWGNHDIEWKNLKKRKRLLREFMIDGNPDNIRPALKFIYGEDFSIFLAHGHQGECHGDKLGFVGRWLSPIREYLGIKIRRSASQNHRRRFLAEMEYYDWAKQERLLLITGHTHRPRFESYDKIDRLQIQIENLCRDLSITGDPAKIQALKKEIEDKHMEYRTAQKKVKETKKRKRLGQGELLIPCYFNPGSCLHEKGITCIELSDREIRLIFYFDLTRSACKEETLRSSDIPLSELLAKDLEAQHYIRRVLEKENLDYIQTRIQLLTKTPV
jgi:predicted phosphodiesterase